MIDPIPSVLVAMSAFKGHLSNTEACAAVAKALGDLQVSCTSLPIGDGGAGTMGAVEKALGGERLLFGCNGAYGEPVEASVLAYPTAGHPKWVYIESSQVCGFTPQSPTKKDALRATSRGLGQLLRQIHDKFGDSLSHLYVGLGDSAISDAGIGMLSELGYQFLDAGNISLWGSAESLRQVRSFKKPKRFLFEETIFTVLCDVMNPLCGPDGSARVFSPQKGATSGQVALIEEGMENLASLIYKETGKNLRLDPMTGSAGGLGAAFEAFFTSRLVQGARFLFDWIQFDEILRPFDWVITGEGKTDRQTLSGKAPKECYDRALHLGKRVAIISGALGPGYENLLEHPNVIGCFAAGNEPSAAAALEASVRKLFSE